jgi:hypothetical protein
VRRTGNPYTGGALPGPPVRVGWTALARPRSPPPRWWPLLARPRREVHGLAVRAVDFARALEASTVTDYGVQPLGVQPSCLRPRGPRASVGRGGLQRSGPRLPAARVVRAPNTHPLSFSVRTTCTSSALIFSTRKSRCTDRVRAPQQACGGARRETHGGSDAVAPGGGSC